MADNTLINAGSGGDTIRDKDRGSAKTQIVALDLAPGTSTEVLAGTITTGALSANSGFAAIALGSFSASAPAANSFLAASVPASGIVGFGFANTNFIGTLCFDATTDGTNWFALSVLPQGTDISVQTIALTSGTHFAARTGCAGLQQVRARVSAFTSGSGSMNIVPTWGIEAGSQSTTGQASIGAVNRMGMGHTATRTSVAATVTNGTTLLAANLNRIGATVFNDGNAILYLTLGSAGSTTDYTVQILSNSYYEVPYGFDGLINGVWATATGNARITEYT